jgi:5-(aminomethyl)-3-furanmethanol phosphate kinase
VATPDAVLKVGGSLGRRPAALRRLMRALAGLARTRVLLVVPGGGEFADQVRRADRRLALGDTAAHWMAILAMDQYAYVLAHLAGRAAVVRGRRHVRAGRLNVLAPSSWLLREDPLPRSWEVTSDSIGAWVARAMSARRFVLVKDVDGLLTPGRPGRLVPRVGRGQLRGVVDGHLGRTLPARMPCWIVNGRYPARLVRLIRTGATYGTEVV